MELEVSLFVTSYDDFTFGRLTGASFDEDGTFFADDSGEFRELVYTQDDARFTGGELEGRIELGRIAGGRLGLDVQLDVVRARLDSENVPRIPPLRWGGGLSWSGPRIRARLGFLRSEAQDRLAPLETSTSAHTLVDATLAWRLFERGDRGIDLHLSGHNLLDETARNHVSLKKEDVLQPGRSLRVGFRGRF